MGDPVSMPQWDGGEGETARWLYVGALLVRSVVPRHAFATGPCIDCAGVVSVPPFVRPIPKGAVLSSSVPTVTVRAPSDFQDERLPESGASSVRASQAKACALSGSVTIPTANQDAPSSCPYNATKQGGAVISTPLIKVTLHFVGDRSRGCFDRVR